MFPLSLASSIILSSIISGIVLPNLFSSISNVSAASLTLTIPSSTLKLDIAPNDSFTKSSAGTVSVRTDAFSGYTLTIKAKDSSDLVNGSSKISSITNTLSEEQYQAAGNSNTWGYQPSKFNNDNNSNFLPSPTTMPSTIEKTNVANSTNANSYNIILGAKVNTTIPTGLYSNVFILSATANTVSYTITYNLNQGTWNGKSPQTGSTTESSVKLDANVPTRDGFEFKGWCTQEPANNDTDSPNCGGQTYDAGQDYALINGANIANLYAIWEKNGPAMQNWSGCNQLTQHNGSNGDSIFVTLTDNRDGNKYKVAKLKDGKCWMVQGLRIVNKTIDSTESDMTSGSFTIPDGKDSSKFVSNDDNNDAAYYNNNQDDGAYYTWYTATAGTGTSSTGANVDAASSICPKGWKLPKGGATGSATSDFVTLVKAYGGTGNNSSGQKTAVTNLIASPVPHFTYAGSIYYGNGSLGDHGGVGYYWSRTARGTSNAYLLYFTSSGSLYPADNNTKRYGRSVRCVAQ